MVGDEGLVPGWLPGGAPAFPSAGALADAITAGDVPPPARVLAPLPSPGDPSPATARALAGTLLGVLQGFLAAPALGGCPLVITTSGAVTTTTASAPASLAAAAAWGLARTAQAESAPGFARSTWPTSTTPPPPRGPGGPRRSPPCDRRLA